MNLDINLIKSNIPNYSDEKLCEMIVTCRYLSFSKEVEILCMEELSKRRQSGSNFEFELFIEKSSKDLPALNFTIPDLRDALHQAIKLK